MRFIFTRIYDFFKIRRPLLFILLLLFCSFLTWSAWSLKFNTEVKKMIPQDEQIASLSNYLQGTKGAEKIVFSIQLPTKEKNTDSLIELKNTLIALLDSIGADHIKAIEELPQGIDEFSLYDIANDNLPLLLNPEDYHQITQNLRPEAIELHLRKQIELLASPAGSFIAQTLPKDPLGLNYIGMQKFLKFNNSNYNIINDAIFSADSTQVLFFLETPYENGNTDKIKRLKASIEQSIQLFNLQYPQASVYYFGGSLVSLDNAVQMQQDTIVTLSITIIVLVALTWYVFKRKRIGFLLLLPVVFGLLFALGILGRLQTDIAVLALGVGAIILGIALDFSIHYLNHAKSTQTSREDVAALANPLSLGAFTTIAAFYILTFAHSSVLKDIGLLASCALLGASLFTLIFLPHLVDLFGLKTQIKQEERPTFIDKFANWKPENNKYLLLVIFILTPVFWYFSDKAAFNGDLMSLNFMSKELKAAENNLNAQSDQTLRNIYLISKSTDRDTALSRSQATTPLLDSLKNVGLVKQFIHPAHFLKTKEEEASAQHKWSQFWTDEKIKEAQKNVLLAAQKLQLNTQELSSIEDFVNNKLYAYSPEHLATLQTLMPISTSQYADTLAYISTIQTTSQDRNNVIALLQNNTKNVVITDNQSTTERLLDYLKEDFNNLVFYSGLLVFLALLIVYGRIELALIAFLPMAISWIWILGIMGIFGLEFNIVNIIICTLIFGLGDDYSIFMMDGLIERYKYGKDKLLLSRSAIYLSALTTIIGLGVLIFAQHPALKGIALIAVLGITCVVVVSQILQPYFFNLLIQNRANKGKMPFTFISLIKSILSFSYFLLGCLLLTIIGLLLVYLRPFGKDKSKLFFHKLLSGYNKSIVLLFSKTKYNIPNADYFKEPAIYIANHTSFLDILLMTSLHPKVLLLTADWVWKSPVMGKIVQLADYYPVSDGADNSIQQLASMRDKGYSIIIFPEGTRSKTDKFLKFKKGAFYLAERLHMDILPVIIHGAYHKMEKNDFLLKSSQMSIHILDRIHMNDDRWGENLKEKRKSITHSFKENYSVIKRQIETPSYFREQLIMSYLYKGPILEWYSKIKSRLEENYEHFHQLLPTEGNFYDLGCGYGLMTYLLHWAGTNRRFIGIDYDEEKIEVAQNNYYLKSEYYRQYYPKLTDTHFADGLDFIQNDLSTVTLAPCNGILLMDVLHYLPTEHHSALLKKCYDALLPGGVILLRDGIIEEGKKHQNTKNTEYLSTKIFRFNRTKNELSFLSKDFILEVFTELGASISYHNYSKNLSNITFIITKK